MTTFKTHSQAKGVRPGKGDTYHVVPAVKPLTDVEWAVNDVSLWASESTECFYLVTTSVIRPVLHDIHLNEIRDESNFELSRRRSHLL